MTHVFLWLTIITWFLVLLVASYWVACGALALGQWAIRVFSRSIE